MNDDGRKLTPGSIGDIERPTNRLGPVMSQCTSRVLLALTLTARAIKEQTLGTQKQVGCALREFPGVSFRVFCSVELWKFFWQLMLL